MIAFLLMRLEPGSRLGPYEITSAIGAGGMGEVYRARDTRLGREVAIKVLPRELNARRGAARAFRARGAQRRMLFQAADASDFEPSADGARFLVQLEERRAERTVQLLVNWPARLRIQK